MIKIKILIVDDHEVVRNGIKLMLEHQNVFEVIIIETDRGNNAMNMVKLNPSIDIVLLDINLPDMDGISVIKNIKSFKPEAKIIALTMHTEHIIMKQVVEAGALGYILKSSGSEELIKALRTVYEGSKYFCNEAAQSIIADQTKKHHSLLFETGLTERETQVLTLISKELTNIEIAEKLNLSKRTIDGHRQKLIDKLGVRNTAGLVKYAVQNGIV